MKYKHIFFDLDRTLWDFDKSSRQAFQEIYEKYDLASKGVGSVNIFYDVYTLHNDKLWDDYRHGKLTKEDLRDKRFLLTLRDFGIDDQSLAEKLGNDYIRLSPLKANLFPQALNLLEYLYPKYKLHIITNGFSEVQEIKIKAADLGKYFDQIITSEEAGVKKPHIKIFEYALDLAGAKPEESLMVGDDYEVDILGAKAAGMDQALFDPKAENITLTKSVDYYLVCLDELKAVL